MKLDNSVAAVVTGGASGLGAATARALAAKGVKVAIFDLQAEKGEALASEIGGVFCEVNVTSDESVDAGFAKAREAHGQERVLVCCAGTGNAVKTWAKLNATDEQYEAFFDALREKTEQYRGRMRIHFHEMGLLEELQYRLHHPAALLIVLLVVP